MSMEELFDYHVPKEQPIGTKLLNIISEHKGLECQVEDKILTIFGIDPYGDNVCPFDDFTFDDYDASFELKDCKVGFHPPEELIQECLNLGFLQCWLCYTDGTEKYFHKNS